MHRTLICGRKEATDTGENESLDHEFNDGVDEMPKYPNKELKKAMIDADFTQTTLAEAIGIHVSNVNAIVNGTKPKLETAQRIVRALNKRLRDELKVSIDYLWPLPNEEDEENDRSNIDGD